MNDANTTKQTAASKLHSQMMALEVEQATCSPRGSRPNRRLYAVLTDAIAKLRAERQAVLR
jgi:hypothetical protein